MPAEPAEPAGAECSEGSSVGSSVSEVARGVARFPARAPSDRRGIERNAPNAPSGATLGRSRTKAKTPEPSGNSEQASHGPERNRTTPPFPEECDDSCPRWRAFRRAYAQAGPEIREELLALAMAWPKLPPPIRVAILTLAAGSEGPPED